MAEITTVKTKRIIIKDTIPWGTYRPHSSSRGQRKNKLTVKVAYNAIDEKIGKMSFSTEKDGKILEVPSLTDLFNLQIMLNEIAAEVEKLVLKN